MIPATIPFGASRSANRLQAPTTAAAEPKLGLALNPGQVPATLPVGGVPLRCRLGFHSWLALGMSVSGARRRLAFSFCRHCPATRSVT